MKILKKVAALSVGLALAVGVGISLGTKDAKAVKADDPISLSDGSYKAVLSYANPIPSSIKILKSSSGEETEATMSVASTGITYDAKHTQYLMAAGGSIVFHNNSNALITKIIANVYQYKNCNIKLGSTTLVSGGGAKGEGNPVVMEAIPGTPANEDVTIERYQTTGTHKLKLLSVEIYLRVGNEPVHVTGVSLKATSGSVFTGLTRQLTATVAPEDADDKSVSWSSSNNAVATVDANGLVSGVAAGEAVITATTTDGGFTASFTATVKAVDYGTAENPITPEEACQVLEATGSAFSAQELYVKGKVSSSYYNSNKKYYDIWLMSSDESVNKCFELFKPTFDSSITTDYTTKDSLKGLIVVCHGYGQIYSDKYELCPKDSTNPVIASVIYTAETLAAAIISETKASCDAYVDESQYAERKAAFEQVWESLSARYNTLSDADKLVLQTAERSESGTDIEKAMARYDYLTGKYKLDNFITGRVPMSFAVDSFAMNDNIMENNTMIIVIAIAAISALAFTTLLVFKKKKQR